MHCEVTIHTKPSDNRFWIFTNQLVFWVVPLAWDTSLGKQDVLHSWNCCLWHEVVMVCLSVTIIPLLPWTNTLGVATCTLVAVGVVSWWANTLGVHYTPKQVGIIPLETPALKINRCMYLHTPQQRGHSWKQCWLQRVPGCLLQRWCRRSSWYSNCRTTFEVDGNTAPIFKLMIMH